MAHKFSGEGERGGGAAVMEEQQDAIIIIQTSDDAALDPFKLLNKNDPGIEVGMVGCVIIMYIYIMYIILCVEYAAKYM